MGDDRTSLNVLLVAGGYILLQSLHERIELPLHRKTFLVEYQS